MKVGTIAGLWRYPVKSMGGERLAAAALSWRGIPGDRGWAVYDESRGGITGAKRLPPLRACRARYLVEPVSGEASPAAEITLPDGTHLSSESADAERRLSGVAGRPVTLRSLDATGADSPRRLTSEGETQEMVRAVMGLLPGEPEPDMSEFPPERLRLLRQGNFFDALPIHVLTRATLSTLARIAPASVWDERRFRPNLVVETDGLHGYPELAWIGRRIRVGSAVLEIVSGCPRCVMVTQPVDDLPPDPRVMRTLVRETRHTAGVYARVAAEGEVRIGDEVALLD